MATQATAFPPEQALSKKEILIALACFIFLFFQILYPLLLLARSPYVQKFGWQMYSRPDLPQTLVIVYPDGQRETVGPLRYFGILRKDIDYLPVMRAEIEKELSPGAKLLRE